MVGNETDFYLYVTKYPHHVIRENKMMAFAGADRLQDGMRLSFGKPIGTAARITRLGDLIMAIKVKKEHVEFAKKAFKVATSKLPLDTEIVVVPLKEEKNSVSYVFDEELLKSEIRKRGAKRVLLQFPEGLRYFSTELVDRLSSSLPDVEFVISGEPSWGACDVSEDEANLLKADLLIHFGHSPYTWYYPKFPTLFVKAESTIDLGEETLLKLKEALRERGAKSVALTSTVQHGRLLSKVREYLSPHFKVEVGSLPPRSWERARFWGATTNRRRLMLTST